MATSNHPSNTLRERADDWDLAVEDIQFAMKMDQTDPLRHLREEFHYPLKKSLPYGGNLILTMIINYAKLCDEQTLSTWQYKNMSANFVL